MPPPVMPEAQNRHGAAENRLKNFAQNRQSRKKISPQLLVIEQVSGEFRHTVCQSITVILSEV